MAVLWNATTGNIVATRIDILSTFLQRAVGLLARPSMRGDEGVLIRPCRAIHTMGMRFPIDVVFADGQNRVLRVVSEVRPNRPLLACPGATIVIELGRGVLRDIEILPGDRLELVA